MSNISNFDSLSAMTALLNNDELQALAKKCQKLIADRERIKRDELRQELTENLQKAIDDILHNDFTLVIENTHRDCHDDYGCVIFDPDDIYSITME
jgi:hypothetical protein